MKDTTTTDPNRALRYNEGKPQWHLLDFDCFEGVVRVMEYGAKKYAKNNWKKGREINDQIDCLIRHLLKFKAGVDIDEESGLQHIDLIGANFMMIKHTLMHHPDLDDRDK